MPQDEKEKDERKKDRAKKRKKGDIFSLSGLFKRMKKRNKRFEEETGLDFKTGRKKK